MSWHDGDFDQAPPKPDIDWEAECSNSYKRGAAKACRVILQVIDNGGTLADVKKVAEGAVAGLEEEL